MESMSSKPLLLAMSMTFRNCVTDVALCSRAGSRPFSPLAIGVLLLQLDSALFCTWLEASLCPEGERALAFVRIGCIHEWSYDGALNTFLPGFVTGGLDDIDVVSACLSDRWTSGVAGK